MQVKANELQKELMALEGKTLVEYCMRLAKFKKENKELLAYLLYEAHDEGAFISKVNRETELQFREMNKSNLYLAKKSTRKILRMISKNSKYSGKKQTELTLLIHFCRQLILSGIKFQSSKVFTNLYNAQLMKIEKALSALHEDEQLDYREAVNEIRLGKTE